MPDSQSPRAPRGWGVARVPGMNGRGIAFYVVLSSGITCPGRWLSIEFVRLMPDGTGLRHSDVETTT
jgi:hypothetical protein